MDIVILYHPFSTAKKTAVSSHPEAAPRPVGLLDTLEVHEPQVKRFRCRVGMVFSVGFTKENCDFYGIFMGFHQQKL